MNESEVKNVSFRPDKDDNKRLRWLSKQFVGSSKNKVLKMALKSFYEAQRHILNTRKPANTEPEAHA